MERISILIADDNEEYVNILAGHLGMLDDIRLAGVAKDGHDTVEKIKTLMPDIVIMDIVMPGMDGIGVLEKLVDTDLYYRPIIVIVSAISSDFIIKRTMELDAQYYFVKPVDLESLTPLIRHLYIERFKYPFPVGEADKDKLQRVMHEHEIISESEEHKIIGNIMKESGILPYASGYQYLLEAVHMDLKGTAPKKTIGREIYPIIAQKYGTTPQKVERAARSAVEKAMDGEGYSRQEMRMPVIYSFVSTIAEKARKELKKRKK